MDDPGSRGPGLSGALAAFRGFRTAQVGRTVFHRSRNLERVLGLGRVHLKFEGGNPTGSQKDRVAFRMAEAALRRGCTSLTAGTCGNYGMAIAFAAKAAGLTALVFLPEGYHSRRVEEAARLGAAVRKVAGDYEAAVAASRAAAGGSMFDANPGGANTLPSLEAYGAIAQEIVEALGDAPASIAVPVSNGTTLAGIYAGFVCLKEAGRSSRVPRMIAASSYRKNPIVKSLKQGSLFCLDLAPGEVRETSVNEPLINWHSFDGEEALHALYGSGGFAEYASDQDMVQYARLIQQAEGLNVLPASTAALVALGKVWRAGALTEDDHVVVLTGRRF